MESENVAGAKEMNRKMLIAFCPLCGLSFEKKGLDSKGEHECKGYDEC